MELKGIVWAGTRTEKYKETIDFFTRVLNIPIDHLSPALTDDTYVTLRLPNGDLFEVLSPNVAFELDELKGAKVDFLVDDVDELKVILEKENIEVLGEVFEDSRQKWLNFRGPDGNIYGATNLPDHPINQK